MVSKEISIEVKDFRIAVLVMILFLVFIMEAKVTLPTPIVFGDEGYHTRMAQWIYQHKDYPAWTPFEGTNLYRTAFDRPPLWNILEASFFFAGYHEMIIKLLTPFIAVLTGAAIYLLSKKIFNENIAFVAAIIAVTVPSFVTYSVLFYTDILAVFYFSLFFLSLLISMKNNDKKHWILAAVFAALAMLTKRTGVVVFPLMLFIFLYELYKKRDWKIIQNYVLFFVIFFLISGTWFLRNMYYYKTPLCMSLPKIDISGCTKTFEYKAATTKNFEGRTTEEGTETSIFRIGLLSYTDFAFGNIWIVPLLFFCGMYLLVTEKKLENNLVFLALISFLFLFYRSTGRAEDTARYTLSIVPLIALVAGIYTDKLLKFVEKYHKQSSLAVFVIIIFFLAINANQKLFVMTHMKKFSPMFFQACDWIKANTDQNISIMTVWGHRVVYNCQRDAAGYSEFPDSPDIILSENVTLAASRMKAHGITHIFVQKFSLDSRALTEKYPLAFVQLLETNPEIFVKIYENGPELDQCLQQGGCDGNILYKVNFIA